MSREVRMKHRNGTEFKATLIGFTDNHFIAIHNKEIKHYGKNEFKVYVVQKRKPKGDDK